MVPDPGDGRPDDVTGTTPDPLDPAVDPAVGPSSRRGVAVVTGGSAGLGRAVVRELTGAGYDVAVLARESEGLHAAAREVDLAGRHGLAVAVDVVDAAAVDAAAERVERELGPIDVWVNNAMTSIFAPFLEISAEEFDRATAVTYLGFVNGTRAALRRMVPRDRGHVVQVGSSLAYRGIPLQSAYCGAKHAMVGFTESVQAELDHEGSAVHLSMVHMPAMNTPQFGWVRSRLPKHPQPVPPIFQPEVGAQAVAYVVQHPRRRTAVSWRTAAITIGNALVPRAFDWYIARTGIDGQQTDEELPVYGDNLERTVGSDVGAHGAFDHRAKPTSPATWLNLRAGRALGVAASAASAAGGVVGSVVGPAVSGATAAVRAAAGARQPDQPSDEPFDQGSDQGADQPTDRAPGGPAPAGRRRGAAVPGPARNGTAPGGTTPEEVARWR